MFKSLPHPSSSTSSSQLPITLSTQSLTHHQTTVNQIKVNSPKMSINFTNSNPNILIFFTTFIFICIPTINSRYAPYKRYNSTTKPDESTVYLWPLPSEYTFGHDTLTVDPDLFLSLSVGTKNRDSSIVRNAFERYKSIIFKHDSSASLNRVFDVNHLRVIISSDNEELQLGVDESYELVVVRTKYVSIISGVTIMANTVYGALHGLETFSQLCQFDYGTKTVTIYKTPWYIRDKPRFPFRGLMLDTARHYYPIEVIKQIIESMSYAKLNVFHWHIIDEESFPLEVPTYPYLWNGSYTKWERYTVEDAREIVNFAKVRGINVMAEIDVPGHAESWGSGYPDLWPAASCREPLDVSKNFTFDLVAGILEDMRQIFPFQLFHLGGDEVNTSCWNNTPHVKQWLHEQNMTVKDAYQYFVVRAQEIAVSKNWIPVNWEETFEAFPSKLSPLTVVHNWYRGGLCRSAVAKGFKCIYSDQGYWYLDQVHVLWDDFYKVEPLEGIHNPFEQELMLGGEVCMWSEKTDASNVQQTIWPRAAAAAERLWSKREATNSTRTALPRLQYFRCLLTRRGVPAEPLTNYYARTQPYGPGSCYDQ